MLKMPPRLGSPSIGSEDAGTAAWGSASDLQGPSQSLRHPLDRSLQPAVRLSERLEPRAKARVLAHEALATASPGHSGGSSGSTQAAVAAPPKPVMRWTVFVDRANGEKLGMNILRSKLEVGNVQPNGLIARWNREHPDKAVKEGCLILEVNGQSDPEHIFYECTQLKMLSITVQRPPTDPGGVSVMHVLEGESLSLGPFEPGVVCDILEATYGDRKEKRKQADVTAALRDALDPVGGLNLPNAQELLGAGLAEPGTNRLVVRYRLHNAWDVSRASYAEGTDRLLYLYPTLGIKAVTNTLGAIAAGTGFLVGKATTTLRGLTGDPQEMADSEAFRLGFMAWLRLNGVWPSVTYLPTGQAGEQLRRLEFPAENPPQVPPKEDMKQTPIILANHVCYIDGFVLAAIFGAPKIIAMAGTMKTPILGDFAGAIGVIEVDRDSRDSRAATVEAIKTHTTEWRPGARSMLLFPEGTTSNGDDLLPFKKGAFVPGKPVRPVVIYYTGDWHPANVNYKVSAKGEVEPTSDSEWYTEFLGHMIHSLQVKVLPPYLPSAEEQADPGIYATNVRNVMCAAYKALKDECEAQRREAEKEGSMLRRSQEWVGSLWHDSVEALMTLGSFDSAPQGHKEGHRRSKHAPVGPTASGSGAAPGAHVNNYNRGGYEHRRDDAKKGRRDLHRNGEREPEHFMG